MSSYESADGAVAARVVLIYADERALVQIDGELNEVSVANIDAHVGDVVVVRAGVAYRVADD